MKKAIYFFIIFCFIVCGGCHTEDKTEVITQQVSPAQETQNYVLEETKDYILNKNSFKIHYPHCFSVDRMKEQNKKYVNDTLSNLIKKGYTCCGNCNPK